MPATQLKIVLDHLRRTALRHDRTGAADADLVECFVDSRDDAAFEALVRRHGPMVLGVCRRVLHNEADAEDAFQATFLVLVRKAGSISPRSMVGNWLYGVAHSTALKAKAMKARRHNKESEAARRPRREVPLEDWQRLQGVLDEELCRLPDRFRLPIVLCELEGKSIKDAARQLGWPQGTVASRLSRGRTMLGKRLARHDLTLPGGTLTAVLVHNTASAALPKTLLSSTLQAAALFAAGTATNGAVISAHVAALTEGMVKAMLVKKLTIVFGLVLLLSIAVSGATVVARATIGQGSSTISDSKFSQAQAKKLDKPELQGPAWKAELATKKWSIKKVDEAKRTIDVVHGLKTPGSTFFGHPERVRVDDYFPEQWPLFIGELYLLDLRFEVDAQILLDGKPAPLGDLNYAVDANLTWTEGKFTLAKIEARTLHQAHIPLYYLESINPEKNTMSVRIGALKDDAGKFVDLPVVKDVEIQVWEGRDEIGHHLWRKNAKISELQVGMRVSLTLSPDASGRLVTKAIIAFPAQKQDD